MAKYWSNFVIRTLACISYIYASYMTAMAPRDPSWFSSFFSCMNSCPGYVTLVGNTKAFLPHGCNWHLSCLFLQIQLLPVDDPVNGNVSYQQANGLWHMLTGVEHNCLLPKSVMWVAASASTKCFFVTLQEGGGAILYHIDQCDVIVLVLHFAKVRGATAPLSHLGSCIADMFFFCLKNLKVDLSCLKSGCFSKENNLTNIVGYF